MEANASTYKKQAFKYIALPSNLIDLTTYVIDFTGRKFIHIGIYPEDQFNVAVQIITPASYISISHEYLTRIYSLIGNILFFILETPDNTLNIIFLADEVKDKCRVPLNRDDLLVLQYMEWSKFEAVVRKSTKIRSMVLHQLNEISLYFKNSTITDIEDMYDKIKDIHNEIFLLHLPKANQNFYCQLKLLPYKQIVERWSTMFEESIELKQCDVNDTSSKYFPPSRYCQLIDYSSQSLPSVDQPMLFNINDGPSFYDFLHLPLSPLPSPINFPDYYPRQSRKTNEHLFHDILCDE